MKGSTAQGILKELEQTELRAFLASIEARPNGVVLRKLCNLLLSIGDVNERDVSEALGLAKGQYYKRINELGNLLLAFDPDGLGHREGEQACRMAMRLLMGASFDAAIEVLELGIDFARTQEEFDLGVRLTEMSGMLPPGMTVPSLKTVDFLKLRENHNQFQRLFMEAEDLGKMPDASLKRSAALSLVQRDIFQQQSSAFSTKALYYFLKSRSTCNAHLRNYSAAIQDVEDSAKLLQENSHLFPNYEFLMARELTVLQILLQVSKQGARAASIRSELDNLNLKTKRARIEVAFSDFPTKFAVAIDQGSGQLATAAIRDFQTFIQEANGSLQGLYYTTNLYWCLTIGLLLQNDHIWTWAYRSISAYSKADFRPRYYPLYRFLEIVRAIDLAEWDEAMRLLKNLKISSLVEEVAGFREILPIVSRLITRWQSSPTQMQPDLTPSESETLVEALSRSDLPDYFDLLRWFEAKKAGRPVLDNSTP